METFNSYIVEAGSEMEPDEYFADAEKANDYLKKELGRMFPKPQWHVVGKLAKVVGTVLIFDVTYLGGNALTDLNLMNSPRRVKTMMHFGDARSGALVPQSKFSIETIGGTRLPKGLKYRKINGKTPMDAAKKFVAWFKKNKAAFTLGIPTNESVNEDVTNPRLKAIVKKYNDSPSRKMGFGMYASHMTKSEVKSIEKMMKTSGKGFNLTFRNYAKSRGVALGLKEEAVSTNEQQKMKDEVDQITKNRLKHIIKKTKAGSLTGQFSKFITPAEDKFIRALWDKDPSGASSWNSTFVRYAKKQGAL